MFKHTPQPEQEAMSAHDWVGLQHLLPEAARDLIRVAGVEAALTLINHYPGTHFPIGKNLTRHGKVLHAALAEVVGERKAAVIEQAYAAQRKLWIPKCRGVVLEWRNRQIRQQFDELTTRADGPMPAYLAVRNLALVHKLVERHIWRIIKQPDQMPEPEPDTLPLF